MPASVSAPLQIPLEDLDYQRRAIAAAVDVLEGQTRNSFENSNLFGIQANVSDLLPEQIEANKRRIIAENGISLEDAKISSDPDVCIEMETGTGKTLVYLRTVYELYRLYRHTKFILFVPSLAIKEGFLATAATFKAPLENRCRFAVTCFPYDSSKPGRLRQFIEDTQPQIMVMTIQSITSDERIINQTGRDDSFMGLTFLQALGRCQPVVLMDEPQEGMDTPNAISRLATLNPLIRLRYSATHTYQNERLLYWPLLDSGDFDLMKPFFAYYQDMLPVRMAITQAWFGHGGAYYRENMEPTGGERDCGKTGHPSKGQPGEPAQYYHDYYFTNGLETTAMMIDYVNYTGDTQFRDQTLVPFARQALLFYALHFPRTPDGKLHLDPAQAIETWWKAVNPAPDVAGLRFCLDGLLAMKAGSADDQAGWRKFRQEIPALPRQIIDGKPALAPADTWAMKHNSENAELYPIFPFQCVGLAEDSADLAEWTIEHRVVKDGSRGACWTQDQIDWALAGNATQAAKGLERRFRISTDMCRFPVYAGRGNDECPDLDHFGSGSIALQRMLVQEGQGKILLLPAWPANWNVDFKLHVSYGGIITGTVKDGLLVTWKIDPPALADKVVVMKPQAN